MKTLYIIRHAKSSWKHPGLTDAERPLNERGKRDAPLMGKRLKERGVMPDAIISSPANRAITTAQIIAREIGFPIENIISDESIYESGFEGLLQLIHFIGNSYNQVFLFGHNPGFSWLANHLATDFSVGNLPTCGIVCLEFEVDSWRKVSKNSGRCEFYDYPKMDLS